MDMPLLSYCLCIAIMTFCQLGVDFPVKCEKSARAIEVIYEDGKLFFRQKNPSKTQIRLFDAQGRLITQVNITQSFDVVHLDRILTKGVYTILALREEDATYLKFFVK